MTRLYFVRHGENRDHHKGTFASLSEDDHLTESGRRQAEQTGAQLADKGVDVVVSSPLPRARQTAEIIAQSVGAAGVDVVDGVREVEVGVLSGERADERTWKEWNRVVDGWAEGRVTVQFPGGENYLELWNRMREAVEGIVEQHAGKRVVVVSHGGILRATLKDLCPASNVAWYRNFPIENASITTVDVEKKTNRLMGARLEGTIIEWADTDHLQEEAQ